jgi:long-chain acyl-CoA synthetase
MAQNSETIHDWLLRMKARDQLIAVTTKDKEKKQWIDLTATQYLKNIVAFKKLLCEKINDQKIKNKTVALISNTRWEWAAFDIATVASGALLAPLYPNLNDEDVLYILNHCEADVVVVETQKHLEQFDRIKQKLQKELTPLVIEQLVIDSDSDSVSEFDIDDFIADSKNVKLEDPITIMYTSGTTGQPKGVLMQHQALISEVSETFNLFSVSEKDTSLSFLPYAHVMGRIEHWGSCCAGYRLAFAESIENLKKNLVDIKPDFLIAVPRIFEKIYAGILNQVEAKPLKKKLFNQAIEVSKKINYFRQTKQSAPLTLILQYEILSKVVFAPVRKAFGGKLRFAISGGAPLGVDLGNFFANMNIKILEGYGLTETFAAVTVNTESQWQLGTVGRPIGDTEIRFDADGEVLVKSKKVLKEYFKNPAATNDVFTADGYFRTGDIGEFTADGFLKITDRKKDLIKTAGGKYVAPQKLEGLLKQEPAISQVLIIGDQRKFIAALISVEAPAENSDLLLEKIKKHIQKINSTLASYDAIKKFEVVFDAWTVDNGGLTPSMKVKRKVLEKKYSEIIEKIYG